MKLDARILGKKRKLNAWTTEREPDAAIAIIVPFINQDGELTDVEVVLSRKSLLAAVKAGALNAASY